MREMGVSSFPLGLTGSLVAKLRDGPVMKLHVTVIGDGNEVADIIVLVFSENAVEIFYYSLV